MDNKVDGAAVLVCWLVIIALLMMGGCFGWIANDIITLKKKEYTHDEETK